MSDWYRKLRERAKYALRSKSLSLCYEVYGMAKIAYEMGEISKEEAKELNTMLVRNGINNPKAKLE